METNAGNTHELDLQPEELAALRVLLNDYLLNMDEDVSDADVFEHGEALLEKLRRYGCRRAPTHLHDLSRDSRAARGDRSDQPR